MFKVISYATLGTPYEEVIHTHLYPSLEKFKLPNSISFIPDKGGWQANTNYKPLFVLSMLERCTENVLFLDADAIIKQDISGLEAMIPSDALFACHFLDWQSWYGAKEPNKELLSGTLWVRNCEESKQICKEWGAKCERHGKWEQKVLAEVLKEKQVKVYHLPLEYCYIATLPDGRPPKVKCVAFVEHWQVSRKFKRLAAK